MITHCSAPAKNTHEFAWFRRLPIDRLVGQTDWNMLQAAGGEVEKQRTGLTNRRPRHVCWFMEGNKMDNCIDLLKGVPVRLKD